MNRRPSFPLTARMAGRIPSTLLLLHAGWILLSSCKNDLDRVAAVEVTADAPDRTTTNAEYFYSDSGITRNRLRAGRIDEYTTGKEQRTEISDGLELVFFDARGRQGSVLTARRGRIWPDGRRMRVNEQVVFVNRKGERLETEELTWIQDSARVHTDKPVKIVRKGDILYGRGLDAAEDLSEYTIREITGSLFVEQGDTLAR